jgi:hypothetical protein
MKKLIFLFLLLPCFVQAQNYTYEITPQQDGKFQIIQWDETNGTQGAPGTRWLFDTSEFRLFTYQLIEHQRNAEASIQARAFLQDLKVMQTVEQVGQFIALDYAGWINGNLAGVYDGVWKYEVRGTATNFNVVISGVELRRQSNNNLLATLSARANNWLRVTLQATSEVINLYQFGNAWVGKRANGNFVTMKK